jgi:hypothetical protein
MNQPHELQEVRLFTEPKWSFRGHSNASYYIKFVEDWGKTTAEVDPTPAYHHDVDLVKETFEHLRRVMPLPIPILVAILGHEDTSRTNGSYYDHYWYKGSDEQSQPYGIIVLSGKRTPIHPAMTRYLVTHEYGHGVQYCWERLKGMKTDAMEPQYIKDIRPTAKDGDYGPGTWHSHVQEMIANDFRILVAQREVEFWPHPGFARPDELVACRRFWAQAQLDFIGEDAIGDRLPKALLDSFTPHESHQMVQNTNGIGDTWSQCQQCQLTNEEKPITDECVMPAYWKHAR